MLQAGVKAPDFSLLDKNGKEITFSNIFKENETVILYFYPKDSTAGCTKQEFPFILLSNPELKAINLYDAANNPIEVLEYLQGK